MLPTQVSASLPPSAISLTGTEKAVEDAQASAPTQSHVLTQFQARVLSSQGFIGDTVQLVEVINDVFGKALPQVLPRLPDNLDTLTEPEKYESLTEVIKQLDVYFHKSPIHRADQGKMAERWNAREQISAIENLDDISRMRLRSALAPLKLSDTEPLDFSDQTALVIPGAAIPRMHLRTEFAITQNSENKSPGLLLFTGSSRTLSDIDKLQDAKSNRKLHFHMQCIVEAFNDLWSCPTELHALLALTDMLRTDNPDCFINQQTVYISYTGDVHYYQQSLQENGEYTINPDEESICTGRPNTEATMVSALNAVEQLVGTTPEGIVLVSNQPHIRAQQLATERVVANIKNASIPIHACGDKVALESPKDLFLAIDSVRKTVQLLNPTYHVTTNWVRNPECKLFKSERPGEWEEVVKPESDPAPPLEQLA